VNTRRVRRRVRWLWFCGGLVLLFCAATPRAAAGQYQTIEVESLKIEFDAEWGDRLTPGYVPVRFDITNGGEARVIEIVGEGSRYFRSFRSMDPGKTDARQQVRLARGDRVRVTMPMPVFANNESMVFEIRENGRMLERLNYVGFESAVPPAAASVLIVADRSTAFATQAARWPRPKGPFAPGPGAFSVTRETMGPGSPGAPAPPPLDIVLEPARLPTNWLGYTSLRAVIIGSKEWEQLSVDQRNALLTWTACGGDLIVADGDLPTLLPGAQRPSTGADDRAVRAYFFGRIHRPTTEQITAAGLTGVLATADKAQDANWALPANRATDWGTMAGRGFRLLIPGVEGVPARAYMLILLVFALLIGPANYWFLVRRRQQVLVVLTAPLISAVFILLLGAYVIAGEGLGVRGRAVTFTMLDQVRKQAVTRASVSLYAAGMTPSGGLLFPRDVAVFAIGTDGGGSHEEQTLDLTEAQRFTSGLIQARAPTNIEQIAPRPARERLSFSREAGGVSVVNGLGATVTNLFYRDGTTTYSVAGPLPSGGRAVLTAGSPDARTIVPANMPLTNRFLYLAEHQPVGSYLAVLDRSPFWDPGITGLDERGSFHLVIGWPEGQP
jgi:hypothetical protein